MGFLSAVMMAWLAGWLLDEYLGESDERFTLAVCLG